MVTAVVGGPCEKEKSLVSGYPYGWGSSVSVGTSQGYGNGGRFVVYDPIVAAHNRSGELIRIQGHCQSACTLFLGIRNVCI